MQQKYIAIGVAVVLVLAAVGGGIALVANSNDNNNNKDQDFPEIAGKWNLSYIETAILCEQNGTEIVAINDASNVKIVEHHVNPFETVMSFEVVKTSDHAFKGKFSHMYVNDVYGTLDGPVFKCGFHKDGLIFSFEGVVKGDNHIACSMIVIKVPVDSTDNGVVVAANYLMFVRDGEKPVPIRTDYFDMRIMSIGNHIKSTAHTVTDFTDGDGSGKDIGVGLEYVHSNSMVSVFNVKDSSNNNVGVQATISLGATRGGTVHGIVTANVLPAGGGILTGEMYIAHGKATFLHYMHNKSLTSPEFIEIEYNVPYYKGGNHTPVYISEKYEYKGTITVRTEGAEPTTKEITKKFSVFDNTIYSETVKDGKKIIWFGEIYGRSIVITMVNENLKEAGQLVGHIDNDFKIHLYGISHGADGAAAFIDIVLDMPVPEK